MIIIFVTIIFYLIGSLQSTQILQRFTPIDLSELIQERPNYLMFTSLKKIFWASSIAFFDFCKGIIPLYVGFRLHFTNLELSYLVIALILGEYYSIFRHFNGGLGTVVAIASYTTIGWPVMGVALAIWLAGYLFSGYRIVANVLVALCIPLFIYYLKNEYIIPVVTLSCIIILRHIRLLIKMRYGYFLPDIHGLVQRLIKDKDFLT